jgi:hypothetical protein
VKNANDTDRLLEFSFKRTTTFDPGQSVLGRPISLAVAGCQPFSPNPRYLRIVRALCKGDHKQKGVFQWVRSVSYMKVQMWRRGIPAKA